MAATGPLRAVKEHFRDKEGFWDALECGHVIACNAGRHELTGDRSTPSQSRRKRRCWKCAGAPPPGDYSI